MVMQMPCYSSAEKASTPLAMGGVAAAKALSSRNDEPQLASRPWDKDRDGFVLLVVPHDDGRRI